MDYSNPLTRLEKAHLWAELVSKVIGGIALLVAGWWTYANFTVEKTHDPTMEVTLSPTVHALRGEQVLLTVDVFLRNIGKVAITPRYASDGQQQDLGLEISLVEMEPLAHETTEPATALPWFDWNAGGGNPRQLLQKRNLLATNEDFRRGRYQLNPGVKYREPFACVVERNKLYAIRARFWTDDGSVADLVYIDTFLPNEGPRAGADESPAPGASNASPPAQPVTRGP